MPITIPSHHVEPGERVDRPDDSVETERSDKYEESSASQETAHRKQ